jgi:hypothetical protein
MRFPSTQNLGAFKTKEMFFEEYKGHLDELLKIVKDVGEPLEGNIFYQHLEPAPGHDLIERFLPKRAALGMFAMAHDDIVEIGFNAGFSALLMLTANPNLRLTSVDICEHQYTMPCYEYLMNAFPGRVTLVKGDSTAVLGHVLQTNKELTGYIIDGGHGVGIAEQDLRNVIQYANKDAVLCFDDSDFVELRLMLNLYMMSGHLVPVWDPHAVAQNETQMFFKISCIN